LSPASISTDLAALFPPAVIATEVTGPVSREQLMPAELQFIAHCAPKRIQDFAAGRACAHRALRELGIVDFSLLAGSQREPLWPASVVGSITHTTGYAAAVVARQTDLKSLGLDCEVIEAVGEDIWAPICTPTELTRLARLPARERQQQAALIFAAKEAFYKCQYPLTHAWVGFEDVDIEPLQWPAATAGFRIIPNKPLPLDEATVAALVCRFRFGETRVLAGVTAAHRPQLLSTHA
jgi:4'-phosphopantetheinyl transferase EntD